MHFTASTLADLRPVAEYLISQSRERKVITFSGQLGAGKTALVKTICELLEVQENVSSPTFSLVNEYGTASGEIIYHFDFYRVKKVEEAWDMGFEEYAYSGNLCLIEWPENIDAAIDNLGLPVMKVEISLSGAGEREIKVSPVQ
ncbi:MAG TPA: tRNA (adenosine(37)-N6)-threonylcarbamoyltransferase complex ATPase subunit type 1 TsaE [Bacteroidia bacterium]|nr:tRNA (adenosine(37)-N6)-threonylcarbamoyltransferase complex ATPase subunit type 1 TsaE [Bacteroidia bacterium]